MKDLGSCFVLNIPSGRSFYYYEAASILVRAYQRAGGLWGPSSAEETAMDWDHLHFSLEELRKRKGISL